MYLLSWDGLNITSTSKMRSSLVFMLNLWIIIFMNRLTVLLNISDFSTISGETNVPIRIEPMRTNLMVILPSIILSSSIDFAIFSNSALSVLSSVFIFHSTK